MANYAPFRVTIANVSGSLFDGQASFVTVPSTEGMTTVLAHHEPHIALLEKGKVTLEPIEGEQKTFEIEKGVLEVHHNHAIVLV